MSRRERLILPEIPLHIIQRGNNGQDCFFSESDHLVCLKWLHEHADTHGCRVHAYVLMTNHVHLLVSGEAPGGLMKALGQRYTQHINWRYGRTGTLWGGRYKAGLVQSESHLLVCQCYAELNPVRAGMVDYPGQYRWSSYRCNAEGKANAIITPHSVYERLGPDPAARLRAYRALFEQPLSQSTINQVRSAVYNSQPLGDAEFQQYVADECKRSGGS